MGLLLVSLPLPLALAAALGSCRQPTEITVTVLADPGMCATLETTLAAASSADTLPPAAESPARVSACPASPTAGRIGDLVLVPPGGDRTAKVELRVLAAVGRNPDRCTPQDFAGCVEARRSLRYIGHEPLALPITLHSSCLGVVCPRGSSCERGQCYAYDSEAIGYCDPNGANGGACVPVDAGAARPTDAGVDAGPDATAAPCPTGSGPAMTRVRAGGRSFCVDDTPVTGAQFLKFLKTKPDPTKQSAVCSWHAALGATIVGDDALPVGNVNWCDAYAFCAWAGKRLCKNLDRALPVGADAAVATSEWYLACSGDGRTVFPYGNSYEPAACRTADTTGDGGDNAPHLVGTYPGCAGGFPGLFDLAGNVHEWTDGCESAGGRGDPCRQQGASAEHKNEFEHRCDFGGTSRRDFINGDVGFRCCAD